MPITLTDSHCHIDFPEFDSDRQQVLARAHKAGVRSIICPATEAANWPRLAKAIATHQQHPQSPALYPAYGLHPMFADKHADNDIERLDDWLQTHPHTVAIGECGLDGREIYGPVSAQLACLEAQVHLACKHDLPLILHAHKAVEPLWLCLRQYPQTRGMLHSYNGSLQQAHRFIDQGYYLSFGGPITYQRARKLHELVKKLPLDALLIETDAPDQPTAEATGRNEPAFVSEVFKRVCQLRSETPEALASALTDNAQRLFNLPFSDYGHTENINTENDL